MTVNSLTMEEELDKAARVSRNAYLRKWRKENPERVRRINIDYWIRRAKRENAESNGSK